MVVFAHISISISTCIRVLTYDEDWKEDSTRDGQRDSNSNKDVLWKEREILTVKLA